MSPGGTSSAASAEGMRDKAALMAAFWRQAAPAGRCKRMDLEVDVTPLPGLGVAEDDGSIGREEFLAWLFEKRPGTPSLLGCALRARASGLLALAGRAPAPSAAAAWPAGSQPAGVEPCSPPEDERVWQEILGRFLGSPCAAARDAQHFLDVIQAGVDPNCVPFPHMDSPSSRGKVLARPLSRGRGATMQPDSTPFPLPHVCKGALHVRAPPDVASWSAGADAEAGQKWLEGLACDVGELRSPMHHGQPLNTELTPWPTLESGVIEADRCTDFQVQLVDSRTQRGGLSEAAVERRRRRLAEVLGAPLNLRCLEEVRPALEKEAALLEMRARWARHRAQAQREHDERAERGAAFVAWPAPGARKWPPVDGAWKRHAQWFERWRAQPRLCPAPLGGLKRSDSTSSLKSWISVSDLGWIEVESQAEDQGWQVVLDEAAPEITEVEDELRSSLSKADLGEIKSFSAPPEGVAKTMHVVCILLGVSPTWEASKKLLGDTDLINRLLGLHQLVPLSALEAISPYIASEDFRPEVVGKASAACASLCRWARALYKYHTLSHAKARAAWAEIAQKPTAELLDAAVAALDTVDIKDLQELKALCKPPRGVDGVCICLMHLLAGVSPAVELTARGNAKHASWKGCQGLLCNPRALLQTLKSFKDLIDEGRVPQRNVERARRAKDEMGDTFSFDAMRCKSSAAAGICAWVINTIAYYDMAAPPTPAAMAEARPQDSEPASDGMRAASPFDCLKKGDITELKCLARPPQGVKAVCSACCLLLLGAELEPDWKRCQEMLARPSFLGELRAFDPLAASGETVDKAEALMRQSFSSLDAIFGAVRKQNAAAASLAQWVVDVIQLRRAAGQGGA